MVVIDFNYCYLSIKFSSAVNEFVNSSLKQFSNGKVVNKFILETEK